VYSEHASCPVLECLDGPFDESQWREIKRARDSFLLTITNSCLVIQKRDLNRLVAHILSEESQSPLLSCSRQEALVTVGDSMYSISKFHGNQIVNDS
jgi:hypothetical protein